VASSEGSIATTSSHSDSLPLAAIEVHDDPSLGSAVAMSEQHIIRPAHAPLEAPLLLPVPELLPGPELLPLPPPLDPPPPPSGEHCESHMADSHWNVGPSQAWQLIVWHCMSCDRHIVSMQSTHSLPYPPSTIADAHTQPFVSMAGEPLDEGESLSLASSPSEPPPEPPFDPAVPLDPELPLPPLPSPSLRSPVVPLEPPQAPPLTRARSTARATAMVGEECTTTELLARPTTMHPTWPPCLNKGARGRGGMVRSAVLSSSQPPAEAPDRRVDTRHLACFPASIERVDGEHRVAIIRDLSESGVLLLIRTTKLEIGDRVVLQLYIAEDSETFRPATGHIVRIEELEPAATGPWMVRVAVHFDEPLPVGDADIVAFRERVERLGFHS